ncbi:VWA domain-containing protein [Sphingomonas sp. 2R-10]|uniref:VWA domain-containing protein n=1 Tax=Sphingomonas sp. 2R-10 TaxID=3045148 RepID=UPI000F79C580|nr:VWA domain-containing protein [Sphingomonas sp. 2R-10]MDJ0276422.1 VWA domain-containing protein [Sphingomonas sp. 2R-10]
MPVVDVTFLQPLAAWLFVLLPLVWWMARPVRRRWIVALRTAVFAVLVVALMQPGLVYRSGQQRIVVVLDQRPAMGAAAAAEARRELARLLATRAPATQVTLVQVGGRPVAAEGIAKRLAVQPTLSAGLDRAVDALPAGTAGRVRLLSDGMSADRGWQHAAAALAERGIPVDTTPLTAPPGRPAITDVRVAPARIGEQVRVRVAVQGDGRRRVVTLDGDGRRLATSAPFDAAGDAQVELEFPAARAGFVPLRVALGAPGGAPVAQATAVAAVQDPLRLLYAGSRQAGAAASLRRLLGPGVAVDAAGPSALGADPADYPLVMLDDVPAAQVPAGAQRRLMTAVRDRGTGLLVSGGRAAFGAGGYVRGVPLAQALPVEARQEEKVEQPTIAVAFIIDTSGSMGGTPIELAKQVARQTVRKLTPRDRVGVVEFYGAQQWAVPMQPATDRDEVERAIGRMSADGASVLFPALQEAYFALKEADTRFRHMVVLTDGGVGSDRYQQLLEQAARDRITVSVVGIGKPDDTMAQWARWGGGRYYAVPDEHSLVALDFRQPGTMPQAGYREGAFPLRTTGAANWWPAGTTAATPPPLDGYARVRTRPQVADTLVATATGDPVLATWFYGAGRVTALMTEPLGAGTARWRGWPGYGAWLARVVAMTARQRPVMDLTVTRNGDTIAIVAQRTDTARPGVPDLRLIGADGAVRPVRAVEQRAPGLFEARLRWPADRAAMVEAVDGTAVTRAAAAPYSDATQPSSGSRGRPIPLAALSAATGGVGDGADAPPAIDAGIPAAADLWPWFALGAMLLYILELGCRRWPSRRAGAAPNPAVR